MHKFKEKVVVGMSGGVDSSVSALLLKEQGYEVTGMFMKNWEEKDSSGACRSSQDFEDVVQVCSQLNIPYYSVNFVKEYWENVFSHFLREFNLGYTPNPDILCNREIKFKVLLDKALEIGADYLATGHYCQKVLSDDGTWLLQKGADPSKDQSYFLYAIRQEALNKALFPVGGMLKMDLRKFAQRHVLSNATKKDSTGICFIGKRDFKEFLGNYIPYHPGEFKTLDGNTVGQHSGAAYYTPGQRKGMGIGGAGDAWFVASKDMEKNIVYVVQGTHHPALYCDELFAVEASWISGSPPTLPFFCHSKVRYRQADQECVIGKNEQGRLHVRFKVPQRAVTPRQSIIFYDGSICLGGAMIEQPGPSYHIQGRPLPKIVSL